jgi:hypothetical protein
MLKLNDEKFEDYLKEPNLHPEISLSTPSNIKDFKNLIIYGPSGVGKYTQMLKIIKKYSVHHLKYEKNIYIQYNTLPYHFKISDIHYEIDMELLGCNPRPLWNELYYHIIDIITSKYDNKIGIIVCKNFHTVHNDILDIFYSYMQVNYVKFILLTESISFIPSNIKSRCETLNISKPLKETYSSCLGIPIEKIPDEFMNIKDIQINNLIYKKKIHICNVILKYILDYNSFKFIEMREAIYNMFIFDVLVEDFIWYILNEIKLSKDQLQLVLTKTSSTLFYYSNNYRPIYHLEEWIYYIIQIIHGL